MWKSNLVVAVVLLSLALVYVIYSQGSYGIPPTAYAVYAGVLGGGVEEEVAGQPPGRVGYRLVVLTDSSCSLCETGVMVEYLREFFPGVRVAYVELDSVTGGRLVEKYGLTTVPAYVLNSGIESSSGFALASEGFTWVSDGYVVNLDDEYVGKRI